MDKKYMETRHTYTVFSDDKMGLLNRITILFNRRRINIDSLTVAHSDTQGISRYTIVVHIQPDLANKVLEQIKKQIDVFDAFVYEDTQVISQEIAMYKVAINTFLEHQTRIEGVMKGYKTLILTIEPDFIVIQQTGNEKEVDQFFAQLKTFGLMEFARSGRVALTKLEQIKSFNY
ncbi:MAG: acetolactate synthase small subunit [Microscillaceae bacterium]|nr:acetolactate synthase small subunit [Microscillaceae bacterium]